jgi:hypothetical protein
MERREIEPLLVPFGSSRTQRSEDPESGAVYGAILVQRSRVLLRSPGMTEVDGFVIPLFRALSR